MGFWCFLVLSREAMGFRRGLMCRGLLSLATGFLWRNRRRSKRELGADCCCRWLLLVNEMGLSALK